MQTNNQSKDDPVEIKQEVHNCPKCNTPIENSLNLYLDMESCKNRSSFEYRKVVCPCGHELALVSTEDRIDWPGKNAYLYGRLLYEYEGIEKARRSYDSKNALFGEIPKT